MAALGLLCASAAAAADVEVPTAPPPPAEPGAAPAPPAAQPSAGNTPVVVRRVASISLRIGSTGKPVRDLQRALRRRGLRVAVDGTFGPATKRAVRRLQARLHLRRTGIADRDLLRRLGVKLTAPADASSPSKGSFVRVFPVAGDHSYVDDWGAARAQGGHEGTDIMAARSTPVVAADAGVVAKMARTESGLGGIYLWLRRSDGLQFYYAHMQSIADGLAVGSPVTLGQIVGTVGNSGDARNGPTHLHFEVRREWVPFDPYPELVAVDPEHAPGGVHATPSS